MAHLAEASEVLVAWAGKSERISTITQREKAISSSKIARRGPLDRELLAYLIIAVLVVAFAALFFQARHNSRERKAARQGARERRYREMRTTEKSELI